MCIAGCYECCVDKKMNEKGLGGSVEGICSMGNYMSFKVFRIKHSHLRSSETPKNPNDPNDYDRRYEMSPHMKIAVATRPYYLDFPVMFFVDVDNSSICFRRFYMNYLLRSLLRTHGYLVFNYSPLKYIDTVKKSRSC